ncbi:MAG: hypothetical protein ACM3O7_04760 [Acidobacteriota bacterium]
MSLLRRRAKPSRASLVRAQVTISCPYNGHQVGWCRGLCVPIGGVGTCGRVAAHALTGRTQAAIAAWQVRESMAAEGSARSADVEGSAQGS